MRKNVRSDLSVRNSLIKTLQISLRESHIVVGFDQSVLDRRWLARRGGQSGFCGRRFIHTRALAVLGRKSRIGRVNENCLGLTFFALYTFTSDHDRFVCHDFDICIAKTTIIFIKRNLCICERVYTRAFSCYAISSVFVLHPNCQHKWINTDYALAPESEETPTINSKNHPKCKFCFSCSVWFIFCLFLYLLSTELLFPKNLGQLSTSHKELNFRTHKIVFKQLRLTLANRLLAWNFNLALFMGKTDSLHSKGCRYHLINSLTRSR